MIIFFILEIPETSFYWLAIDLLLKQRNIEKLQLSQIQFWLLMFIILR